MINPGLFGGGFSREPGAMASAASAQSAARSSQRSVSALEERLDRLSLVCMAMWSLIQDKTNVTEQDLMERVKLIDLMDGVEDGKATRTVSKCSKCGRVMSPRHQRCLYCGAEKLVSSVFDKI